MVLARSRVPAGKGGSRRCSDRLPCIAQCSAFIPCDYAVTCRLCSHPQILSGMHDFLVADRLPDGVLDIACSSM